MFLTNYFVLTIRTINPARTITTDKQINTIEKDPPAREIRAPNVIGAMKPPRVDPVLITPTEDPITFSGRILCGQENTPTKIMVKQNVSVYNRPIDSANELVITKPANAAAERIELLKNKIFSLLAKNLVNKIPANKEAIVPPTALIARIVPTVLIDSVNFSFKKEGSHDIFP